MNRGAAQWYGSSMIWMENSVQEYEGLAVEFPFIPLLKEITVMVWSHCAREKLDAITTILYEHKTSMSSRGSDLMICSSL